MSLAASDREPALPVTYAHAPPPAVVALADFTALVKKPHIRRAQSNMNFLNLGVTNKKTADNAAYALARQRMIREIRAMTHEVGDSAARNISEKVLGVMANVPRHRFVPADEIFSAYYNHPLPIGHGQTISQPYIVALMTELLAPDREDRVLEVGTGSGYQTAILAEMAARVYGMEIVGALAERAANLLGELGYANVQVKNEDGNMGWPEHAPFDKIIVTAAAEHVPQPLLDQLRPGERMVIPVGDWPYTQQLILITKTQNGATHQKNILPVSFVPLTGGH